MSDHISVRFKGSRWVTTAHRAAGRNNTGVDQRPRNTALRPRPSAATSGDGDLLLNLAVRHFAGLQLTSREADAFARALTHAAATGRKVSVHPETSSPHTYEIGRRRAAVTIRFGSDQMHLPLHAARELAAALRRMRNDDEATTESTNTTNMAA